MTEQERRWPTISEAQERDLHHLERALSLPNAKTQTWTEKIPKLGHWGRWGHEQFKEVTETRGLTPEEKARISISLIGKLYESLRQNEVTEQIAKEIIAAGTPTE